MQHAICFVSSASAHLPEDKVETLLMEWREKNNANNIKGMLLFSEGNFFQVLEGEKNKVLELFEQIREDPRHHSIIQVVGKDLSTGSFDDYIAEHLKHTTFSKPELVSEYCESVKGMDPQTQRHIKIILETFIDTRAL
jgi:hypothetical protein